MSSHRETGLIGIGLLGSALAERLLKRGFTVVGFDISEDQRNKLAADGGIPCSRAEDVFRRCPVVFLSLPNSNIVAKLLEEASACIAAGQVVLDTTTGSPNEMIAIGQRLRERGVHYVETTVAGSSEQLRNGTAKLFVGGESPVVEELAPLLSIVADAYFHVGSVGTASRFKLVHNLVLGLHRAVLAEGLTFAEAAGLDPKLVLEILKQTPAASAVMETKGHRMLERDFAPQAKLAQHLKDVRLIIAEGKQHGAHTPLSLLHEELLQRAVDLGCGDADNAAVIEAFRPRPPTSP